MSKSAPSTSVHREPIRPAGARTRPVLICAFPEARAIALPDSGTVIGRAWLAERGFVDSQVSSEHLRIDRAGGALRVSDVGSRNGSWVNGVPLRPNEKVPLDDGAVLRLGRLLFVSRERFEGPLEPASPIGGLVGPFGLRSVARAVSSLTGTPATNVLLEGETGVGKELVARAVAAAIGRTQSFAPVNVAALPAGVFESQLFGHVAGAFSGAGVASPGIVVAHDGGTIFLDEIGELDLALQAKLLRLLDNREVLPVGAQRERKVDVLVIAATNRDLEQMVEAGSFRRDLLARLASVRIQIPPLRDRVEDLFGVMVELVRRQGGVLDASQVEVEAVERLMLEPWAANVRGLDAALLAARRRDPDPGLRLWALEEVLGAALDPGRALTHDVVESAILAAGGNVTAAAAALGVSRGKILRIRKRWSRTTRR
jgi:hypothetical protein